MTPLPSHQRGREAVCHCPKCGEDTDRLHEGYCFECSQAGQSELNTHNAQFDIWERMSDAQRDCAIKDAFR